MLEIVNPLNLEVALAIEEELKARIEEVDRLRRQAVERAQQEADLARRRYLQVDPDNRLVADQLEAYWNNKLRAQREAHDDYERKRETDQRNLNQEQRQKILALAADFPKVWNDPKLPHKERKKIARLLFEDVTLRKEDRIILQVRFKGGANRTMDLPLPLPFCVSSRTRPEVVEEIDRLLDKHTYEEIVDILNAQGLKSGDGRAFNLGIVGRICKVSGLKSRRDRLREQGLITRKQMARRLRISVLRVTPWCRKGWIFGHRTNYKNEYLYEPPSAELIAEIKEKRRHEKRAK